MKRKHRASQVDGKSADVIIGSFQRGIKAPCALSAPCIGSMCTVCTASSPFNAVKVNYVFISFNQHGQILVVGKRGQPVKSKYAGVVPCG